jgi:MFS family permease
MGAQIGTIILATSIVQLALGFFGTFVSLRVKFEQFDATSAGLVLSSYYAGFVVGAVACGGIIMRVGYVRAYAAFAGCAVAAIAIMPIWISPLGWILSRCVIGFGCAGLFVTTESWLNAKAPPSERGRLFSLYMVALFLALALGQLLIIGADIAATRPFNLLTVLFAVALVMMCTTRAETPRMAPEPSLAYGDLARAAPLAVGAAAASGFIASCFYTLVPAWMQGRGVPQADIALVMLGAVLGGLAFQVPVGRLSDRLERRLVIALVGMGFTASALAILALPPRLMIILPAAALLGGFMSTLYPVSVAHGHDRMTADRVVSVSSRLILVNGLGAILGPIVGTSVMTHFAIDGVFYLVALVAALLSVLAVIERSLSPATRGKQPFQVLDPQAAPLPGNRRPFSAGT